MKRVGYLYERITSIDNCREAIIETLRKKKWKRGALAIMSDIERYAKYLSENPLPDNDYREKRVVDKPSGKVRDLLIPSTLDLCRQHMVMRIVSPILERSFHPHSYACRKGYGFMACAAYVRRKVRQNKNRRLYFAKLDVVKFYDSIDKDVLKALLRRKFKDEKALSILDAIIDGSPRRKGLPIGNYTSQILANYYLTFADYKIADGIKPRIYARYADDMLLFHTNKRKLIQGIHDLSDYLISALRLSSHMERVSVKRLSDENDGFADFCGFKLYRSYTKVRKRTFRRIRRTTFKAQKFITVKRARSFTSYWGYLVRADLNLNKYRGMLARCSKTISKHDIIKRRKLCHVTTTL